MTDPVLIVFDRDWGKSYIFWCPGCKTNHMYDVRTDGNRPNWSFNGDMDRPSFTPSLFYPDRKCHLYLTDGKIQFLGDCAHGLAGQTIALTPVDEASI